ncbi:carbohydrate ABC transporter permease [Dictyobacter arantiisoli]|uniref:Sugar ABC transporter permease n=1 Tax=Dictyobacter arantiisoli TaxID=2014874 RepID=A0A5A5TD22_9CHLR|nr:sugar ABC transporter permease [Dictyobacter arantiisoli]GCF08919.1 sugar ABC transporter permease [Dictyobacter arantiisoli]
MTTHAQEMSAPAKQVVKASLHPRARRQKSRIFWIRFLFVLPVMLYLVLFFGYPLYYSISVSLEKYDLSALFTGNAPFIGLQNYTDVLQDSVFQQSALHTLLFTVGSIVPQFVIGLALAVFFTKKFPLSSFLRSLMLLPWLLPIVVSGTIWTWLFDGTNGVIDQVLTALHILPAHFAWLTSPSWALFAIIITNIWIGIPFNMVLLYSGLTNISPEFYEASSMDGAGKWQQFFYVTLPLLRPVVAVVLMLGLIYTLKVFDLIYVMTKGGPANSTQIFATWSYNLSFSQQLFGNGAALGNMILIVALIVAVFYIRFNKSVD